MHSSQLILSTTLRNYFTLFVKLISKFWGVWGLGVLDDDSYQTNNMSKMQCTFNRKITYNINIQVLRGLCRMEWVGVVGGWRGGSRSMITSHMVTQNRSFQVTHQFGLFRIILNISQYQSLPTIRGLLPIVNEPQIP